MFSHTANWILFCVVHSAQSQTAIPEDSDIGEQNVLNEQSALYDGSQLWQADLRGPVDILLIKRLMDDEDISVWKLNPRQADFLVKPTKKVYVHRQLKTKGLNHTVLIMNVQRRIDSQTLEPDQWDKHSLRRGHRMNWKKYPTFDIINEYMDYLAKNYPSICQKEVIGRSHEQRNITMIKVSNGNPSNKGILVNAGAHAREWLAITSALVILRELVTKFDSQPSYIKDKNWYIIPVLNPDGFVYTHTNDRFWRKNRRQINGRCRGVDLNRNFNATWYVSGISQTDACKDAYIGTHPFSEAETVVFQKAFLKLKDKLNASMDLHTYGQIILYPWSSKSISTAHKDIHDATAAGMSKVIRQRSKNYYRYGHTYHVIYPATGSLLDWVYQSGIIHSYVIEGQDKGSSGFLVPPSQIEVAGMEMLDAVKHLAHVVTSPKPRADNAVPWF